MNKAHSKFSSALRNAAVLLLLALTVALAPRAEAHARMVKSIPAKDGELTASPGQIDLWFNELLEDGFNKIEVYPYAELDDAKHSNHIDGKVTVVAKDRTHLTVKLGALAP